MNTVPDATLLGWCDNDPRARYPFAAAIASLFQRTNDENPDGWKDIARNLLVRAPDQQSVFEEMVNRLHTIGGSGPLSSQYDSRLKLLEQLDVSDMPVLAQPLANAKETLRSEVDAGAAARPNVIVHAVGASNNASMLLASFA
jgi:hypothetical protein